MLVGMRFEEIAEALAERVAVLEPDAYAGSDAAGLAAVTTRIRNLADTATLLLAKRATDTGGWANTSHAVRAEQWLANLTGTTEHVAGEQLRTAQRLETCVVTEEHLRTGTLSLAQAAQVSAGAAADSGAETQLLQVAQRDGMRALREESQRVITAAGDEDAERARVRRDRHLGTRTEGFATRGWFSGPTEEVAELLAALRPLEQDAFDTARRRGEHESAGAYRFDALVALARGTRVEPGGRCSDDEAGDTRRPKRVRRDGVRIRVGLDRLLGRNPTPGEDICEIPGVGPVPVARAREVLAHGLLELVITDGIDVHTVVSSTRHVPAALRLAIAERDDGRCKIAGCDRRYGTQRHHTLGYAEHHRTAYDTLGLLCSRHHHLVHDQGHHIIQDSDGTWRLRAPARASPHADAA